jgi:hypothetical protein
MELMGWVWLSFQRNSCHLGIKLVWAAIVEDVHVTIFCSELSEAKVNFHTATNLVVGQSGSHLGTPSKVLGMTLFSRHYTRSWSIYANRVTLRVKQMAVAFQKFLEGHSH